MNPTAAVAPPRLKVTILPLDWHVWMSGSRKVQLARLVPAYVGSSELLQIWDDGHPIAGLRELQHQGEEAF